METEKNSGKPYKKMNTRNSKRPVNRTGSAERRQAPRTAKPKGNTSRTISPTSPPSRAKGTDTAVGTRIGHALILLLITLIIIGLAFLIYLFFRPGRVQIWQPGTESSPVIERLEPEEPVVAVKEEDLPEQKNPDETDAGNQAADTQMREMKIYFVKVNTEGQISLKSTIRSIDFSSTPLTRSINSLVRGPGSDEINKGSLTLIPDGTRLLSARVENGTAYLNFNEAFRFNPLGREGYLAQLKQVIYTTTEFSNIKDVQIMIEGVVRDYLGGEGFYIGAPLSRESFQNSP